ncbi:MAG: IPExxxVDY family protein [Bacteroidetes bacterium]|nr:IPExxxVDY family protein [Bacteroidota bacterium]MBK7970598.1 IPExxxVDY family protein [Bacteroidota bacterium]MBK9045980.1 IPExxxVDY family protein [Bacteroidota bacterium]MBL0073578.1 IPExxxVDY family protein [Bacteroidota bacterium]
MSKKILKLDFEQEYDFLLIAVLCGFRDYRFVFELNETLGINLCRMDDIVLPAGKPGSSTRHSHFIAEGNDQETYHVISNRDKAGTGFYIPELKNIDYFILISGAYSGIDAADFIKLVRSIELVSGAYEADPFELKSAEAFLLLTEN